MKQRSYKNLKLVYSFCMIFFILGNLLLGDNMKNTKYDKIADKHKVSEDKMSNAFITFLSGGLVGLFGELIIEVFCSYGISRVDASTYMIVIFIFLGSLCTALGFFDKLVSIFKCGLLIPITGFASSMTSSSLDCKREGPIYGIGSNMFKLTGSVILYGIVSAFIFGLIRYLIGGV